MRAVAVVQALALVGIGLRGWPCAVPQDVCVCPTVNLLDRQPPDGAVPQGGACAPPVGGHQECWLMSGSELVYPVPFDGGILHIPGACSPGESARGCATNSFQGIGGPLAPPELPA